MQNLTKQNFWDEMELKYPKAMTRFKLWIDKYKQENDWERLFANFYMKSYVDNSELSKSNRELNKKVIQLPKYHDLPVAMQWGIFLEYFTAIRVKIPFIKIYPTNILPGFVRAKIEQVLEASETYHK